jgi:F-type H+-transporting ATPase subunit delta
MDPTEAALAARYGEALLGTLDRTAAEEVAKQLEQLAVLVGQIDGADEFFSAGPLDMARRGEIMTQALTGRVDPSVEAFVGVLAQRGRLALLAQAAAAFRRSLDRRQGKVPVTVTTAISLSDERRAMVAEMLTDVIGSPVVLTARVDTDLLGGAVVHVRDRAYDASLRRHLDKLQHRLAERLGQTRKDS